MRLLLLFLLIGSVFAADVPLRKFYNDYLSGTSPQFIRDLEDAIVKKIREEHFQKHDYKKTQSIDQYAGTKIFHVPKYEGRREALTEWARDNDLYLIEPPGQFQSFMITWDEDVMKWLLLTRNEQEAFLEAEWNEEKRKERQKKAEAELKKILEERAYLL